MKLRITMNLDNAAFSGENGHEMADEVERILTELANNYHSLGRLETRKLRDYNGNTIGQADYIED